MNSRRPAGEDDLQATIDALSSPVRREILWMLWDAELPAGEIAAGCGLTAGDGLEPPRRASACRAGRHAR